MISRPIENLLDMGEVTVTKVIVNDQMIGDFTLIMPAGGKMENNYFIEIYSRQIDMFMTRVISDEQLQQSEEEHRFLIENSHDIIYTLTADGVFTFVSPAWTTLLGHPVSQVVGKSFQQFVHPDDIAECLVWLQKVIETGQRQKGIEYRVQHADGSWYWHTSSAVPFRSKAGVVIGLEGTARDITERKQAEAELIRAQDELESAHRDLQKSYEREQTLARIDDMTGINNHRSILQLAEREFDVAMRYRTPLSMMFLDIDFFKQINDTFGHLMGDQALKKMIQVICAELRSADVIGRYGGDEFVILLPQTTTLDALPLAERIHASIASMCLNTDKGPLTLTISIGIAQTIHDTAQPDTVENLLLRADRALYDAKQAGRNCTMVYKSITSAT
jgi:diguanylate cyclase (GGDEF)-like protein/PAS domain S-box-containing protein